MLTLSGVEQHPSFEGGQDIRDRSFEYACRVVDFCRQLSEGGGVGRLMVPQLLSCSLSFATMLEEARSAESDADFISKCCIGLKEARESWTRMRVCQRCRIGLPSRVSMLVEEGNELIAIVTTIIKNKQKIVCGKASGEECGVQSASGEAASAGPRIPNSRFLILNS